ncbi:MAG: hypothetical protein JO284_12585 [Planctomycetaceae bacterium]|nr:hypothetical protein [Planctomycetaceae bacterium]MBV8558511.1 hypothetical protein [Planctomycetaceae bacterium]
MHIRGIIQSAALEEHPPDSGTIEMVLRVQGVGPSQPRTLVIPYARLLQDESLDPDAIARRGFEAEIEPDEDGRWIIQTIAFASRILRPPH